MLIGYARVSTQDQNLELQREALTKAACQKVFEDKVSRTRAEVPGLVKALETIGAATCRDADSAPNSFKPKPAWRLGLSQAFGRDPDRCGAAHQGAGVLTLFG